MINRKGFTLVEVVVAMTISLIVITGLLSIVLQISKSSIITMARADQAREVRTLVDRFYYEVRSIKSVHQAVDNKFEFTRINSDGGESRLRYSWAEDDHSFVVTDIGSGDTRALSGIKGLVFSYFDRNGVQTSNLIDVNAIRLSFVVEKQKESGDGESKIQTPLIAFRNRQL